MQPELSEAQQTLANALEEACRADLDNLDTGELIKIDEALEVASKAAKDAVSMRLRMRSERDSSQSQQAPEVRRADVPFNHRVFDDTLGKRWHVFAVQNQAGMEGRRTLPDAFRQGWLVFESSDELRRLAPIPEKWEEISVDELRALCTRAASSPRRKRQVDGEKGADPTLKG
jgi:hypothetical protein